ncbi:MAG: GTP-binding protein [Deltaproteobacteria bacterium]|nr:GTP-binding protein [Deltaproteobacteria bacterium]
MSARHVAVDVVTGFLGSGKTTLLVHALAHGLAGKRVALVVNEIGEIGVDGKVVTGLNYVEKMVELSSGCICCSIDEYRFDLAIQEIIETARPDLIVIESTGLADPEPLAYRVKNAGLQLDAVITVVDAAHVERFLDETEVAAAQIAAADFLVVSKTDLAGPETLARVRARLARLNPRALQFVSLHGAVDADVLFATDIAGHRARVAGVPPATSAHLARDGFGSFAYRGRRPLEQVAFERLLHALPPDVIRAKGLVRLVDRDWHRVFNVTCGRVDLGWVKLEDDVETQAVFIGRGVDRHRDAVVAALAACER